MIEHITPLHDRLIVKHMEDRDSGSLIQVVRENPHLADFVGQGMNGEHDDNRRTFLVSLVLSVGRNVRGIAKGDVIVHAAWDDLPDWFKHSGFAMIREADVAGHLDQYAARS